MKVINVKTVSESEYDNVLTKWIKISQNWRVLSDNLSELIRLDLADVYRKWIIFWVHAIAEVVLAVLRPAYVFDLDEPLVDDPKRCQLHGFKLPQLHFNVGDSNQQPIGTPTDVP